MRDTAVSFLLVLLPLFLTATAAGAAWLTKAIASHIKDKRVALALEVLANGAAAVVASLAQTTVADLKDPTKPGSWNAAAAASVKAHAVEMLRRLYPQAVALATEALQNPSQVTELLGTVVEGAVVAMKDAAPAPIAPAAPAFVQPLRDPPPATTP